RQLGATAYVKKAMDFSAYFGSIQALMRDWLGSDDAPSASVLPPPPGVDTSAPGETARSPEEAIVHEGQEMFAPAQAQVRLAQQLRVAPSPTARHRLYGQLQAQFAALAHSCEQAQRLVGSWLTTERP